VHAEHADKLESVAVKIWLPFVLLWFLVTGHKRTAWKNEIRYVQSFCCKYRTPFTGYRRPLLVSTALHRQLTVTLDYCCSERRERASCRNSLKTWIVPNRPNTTDIQKQDTEEQKQSGAKQEVRALWTILVLPKNLPHC
jgi:hypothetical protein